MALVAALQTAITIVAAATGGSIGLAIITVSISVRIALLPFTIRLARRAEEQRNILEHIRPELDRLKARYAKQPDRLANETVALYRRHGVKFLDSGSLALLVLQFPVISALYAAIARGLGAGRAFLWIMDLAKPDLILVGITGALTYFTSLLGSSRDVTRTAAVVSAALTVAIMWRLSAALGLYWASSTAVGALQSLWLRYHRKK